MTYSLSPKLESSSASLAMVTADNSRTVDNWYYFGMTACLGFCYHYRICFMELCVVQSLVQGEYKMLMDHFAQCAQVCIIK